MQVREGPGKGECDCTLCTPRISTEGNTPFIPLLAGHRFFPACNTWSSNSPAQQCGASGVRLLHRWHHPQVYYFEEVDESREEGH